MKHLTILNSKKEMVKISFLIHYTVDDMGDYFYVAVTIQDIDHMIQFVFDLDKQKNTINNFAYQ